MFGVTIVFLRDLSSFEQEYRMIKEKVADVKGQQQVWWKK